MYETIINDANRRSRAEAAYLTIPVGTPFRCRLAAKAVLDAVPDLTHEERESFYREADPMRPIGWVIYTTYAGDVIPCGVRNTGNLVDAGSPDLSAPTGMTVFGRHGDESNWPRVFATIEECQAEINATQNLCNHQWAMVSHEEDRCSKCGRVRLVPDID